MTKVIECARALGEAVVASEEFKQMQIAEKAATSDPAVAEAMGRYMELKQQLENYLCEDNPDPAEIARLSDAADEAKRQMNAIPAVDEMTSARQRFSDMMTQVNRVMQFIIVGETEGEEGGCTGNCASCAGCH